MKAKKIVTIIVTVLAVGMVISSALFKFMHSEQVVKSLEAVGVGDYIFYLGLMELLFAALFIYPKTMKIGFILLVCYFAGALGAELAHGAPLNALTPMVLIWISAMLRDRYIFLNTGPVKQVA